MHSEGCNCWRCKVDEMTLTDAAFACEEISKEAAARDRIMDTNDRKQWLRLAAQAREVKKALLDATFSNGVKEDKA